MKLSGRETFLIIILCGAILLLAYYFLLLAPAQDRMEDSYRELSTVTEEKKVVDSIIAASHGLETQRGELDDEISTLEQTLLPVINSEAIARRLQQNFIDSGIPFFVSVSTESTEYFRTMLPDNTYSSNSMEMVRFNITVSGSDGFLLTLIDEDGDDPTHVGYNEFIEAVKKIEEDYPEAVRIHSIRLEDSNQGFMLFSISVDVFAFNLPSRLSTINQNADFVRWEGTDLSTIDFEGIVGIPFENVPEHNTDTVRPFAKYPVTMDMLLGFETEPDIDLDTDDE